MEYIYLGKIVNTHGIKGEVRIISNFRYKSRVFVKGFTIYIGKKKDKEVIDRAKKMFLKEFQQGILGKVIVDEPKKI